VIIRSSGDTLAAAATRVLTSFQECEPRLLRPPFDEGEIEDNQVVGIVHANKRRSVEKALLGKFKDKLVEVFGRHVKRIHQGRLDSAGYFGDPAFVVPAFDYVDFGERHELVLLCFGTADA